MLNFLTESSRDFKETETIGAFSNGVDRNSFDHIFTEAYENLLGKNVDLLRDVNTVINNKAILASFKDQLLGELMTECAEMEQEPMTYGTHANRYSQVSDMFDNCVDDFLVESTRVGNLLPIKAIDFPVLVKQALKLTSNDIIQTEVTRTPVIKKHLEQTYIVDSNDKTKRWKYPQCFFTGEFMEAFNAGKGLPISTTPVAVSAIKNYNIVDNLTTAVNPAREFITFNLQITKAIVEDTHGEEVEIVLNPPMRINMSDNTWLGGKIKKTVKDSVGDDLEVDDLIMGMIDFNTNSTSISTVTGQVKKVVFGGYLSNELNERRIALRSLKIQRLLWILIFIRRHTITFQIILSRWRIVRY